MIDTAKPAEALEAADLDNLYWKVTGTVTGVLLVHFIGLYYHLGNKLDGIQQQLFTLASELSG